MDYLDALDGTDYGAIPSDEPTTAHEESTASWGQAVHAAGQRGDGAQPGSATSASDPGSSGSATKAATTHVVQKGETLGELSARYDVPVSDIIGANPAIRNPDLIHDGQTLTVPLDKAGGTLPGLYLVQRGDTLSNIAGQYHAGVQQLAAANNIRHPDRIRAGEQIWIPGAGGQAGPGTAVAPGQPGATPPGSTPLPDSTPQALKVNNALLGVQSAGQALSVVKAGAAKGNGPARTELQTGSPQQNLANAQTGLQSAVNDEITSEVGAGASASAVAKAGQDITSRYANDPAAQKLIGAAVAQVSTNRQVTAIVAGAQSQSDPVKALHAVDGGYAKAPQSVQQAVLADLSAEKIIDAAVRWANQPMAQKPAAGEFPQAQSAQAMARMDSATQGLDKTLAGAVVNRAMPAYKSFHDDPQNGGMSLFGMQGMTTLMDLSGRIAGSAQGDQAIAGFAATGAWNGDAVRNAIGAGADPAYAIELAQQIKASGQDPSIVVQTINDGIAARDTSKIANGGSPDATLDVARRMQADGLDASGVVKVATDGVQQFKDKVNGDIKQLAQHDSELAWLVQNDGSGMTPQQLNQAVAAYRAKQGPAWEKADAALRQQVADDGTRLTQQMIALNQSSPRLSGSSAQVDQTLKTIANDPSAGLAISTAISSDPKLGEPATVKNAADVFTLSKVGDIGRKFTNELGAAYVRQNVLSKLQGVDLNDPASVAQAKTAIHSLESEPFARAIGVTQSDLKKPVAALEQMVDRMAGSSPEEAQAALADFNKTLNTDASLSKAFNKATLPGQLLRGVAVGFAGASVINSYKKFNANPSDPQNGIKLLVDAAGFAQKNTELLVGLGKIDKGSVLGQFGGEWKLAGRASASDLLTGISAVLDGVSAVRAGFGLGEKQDTGSAVFSATTAVGGALTVAPAFGAAAWLGPVGLGVVAVGVVGNTIYQDVKGAHQYEGVSKDFLKAGGYNDAAAGALSQQGGVISGASGAAQMPFLAKYAEMKHLTPTQLQGWVKRLTPEQVNSLAACLLQTAGDSSGNAGNFTNGPPQTQIITGGSWYPAEITLANTLGAFEGNLAHDHVPLP